MDYITPGEMREAEARAASYGLGPAELMEKAGEAVARMVEERFRSSARKTVLVVCGLGNNGGDGFVAARHLAKTWTVRVLLLGGAGSIKTEEAVRNWERVGGTVEKAVVPSVEALAEHREWFAWASVVVDAVMGTGVVGEVREPYASAIIMINAAEASKVSVDVPSGLDPEVGKPASETVRADVTVALHRAKTGLRGKDGYTGEVVVVPIGIRDRDC